MHPLFMDEVAAAHAGDLLRAAEQARLAATASPALRSFPRLRRALGRALVAAGDRIAPDPCPEPRHLDTA
jgi:hypothetical protein